MQNKWSRGNSRTKWPNNEKVEKSCWQREKGVVEYNSCQRGRAKSTERTATYQRKIWRISKKILTNWKWYDIIFELLESDDLYIEKWTVWVLESVINTLNNYLSFLQTKNSEKNSENDEKSAKNERVYKTLKSLI